MIKNKQWHITRLSPDSVIFASLCLFVLILPVVVLFLWKAEFNAASAINYEKFGTFGDFIGGVLGSIWALCGVILFYLALVEQRKDFKTNKEAFNKQIEALEIQTKEFGLQRNELIESRKIAVEQSKTFKQQRLESTYFSLLELYTNVVSSLNTRCESKDYFGDFASALKANLAKTKIPDNAVGCHANANECFINLFYEKKQELMHYYRLVYRIIVVIDESEIGEIEKTQYIKILRSQLSENEALALYYNSHSIYGEDFYKLMLKYNLLKHLPAISKFEFYAFTSVPRSLPPILRFTSTIFRKIEGFLIDRDHYLRSDSFDSKIEFKYPLEGIGEGKVHLSASDSNVFSLKIVFDDPVQSMSLIEFDKNKFSEFVKAFLWDVFFFSRYIEVNQGDKIEVSEEFEDNEFTINVLSAVNLHVNSDKE